MKSEISSVELKYIVKELQFLIDAKVSKIFMDGKKEMFLQIHKTSVGKIILRINTPNYMYSSSFKPELGTPSNFCMALRKRLNNARITSLGSISGERIAFIEFATKETTYRLYFEFFFKGNIILVDSDNKIDLVAEIQTQKDRHIKPKQKYVLPNTEISTLKKELGVELVRFLAKEMNLGGEFAEEVCYRIGIEKKKKEISEHEIERLNKEIDNIKSSDNKSAHIYYNKEKKVFPFEMSSLSGYDFKTCDSFNQALDFVFTPVLKENASAQKTNVHDIKIKKMENIIKAQKQALERAQNTIEESTKKGDLIYQNFTELNEILEQLKKARQTMTWKEIKEKLKGHKIIKNINEKKGTMIIDL